MNTDHGQSVFIPSPAKPESVFIRVTLRSLSRTGLRHENVHPIALAGRAPRLAVAATR